MRPTRGVSMIQIELGFGTGGGGKDSGWLRAGSSGANVPSSRSSDAERAATVAEGHAGARFLFTQPDQLPWAALRRSYHHALSVPLTQIVKVTPSGQE